MPRAGVIAAAVGPAVQPTSSAVQSSSLYSSALRRTEADLDEISSISSSEPSIPSYASLRITHIVAGLFLGPLVLCLFALTMALAWHDAYWQELGLGFVGLLAAESIRQVALTRWTGDRKSFALLTLFASAFIVEAIRLFLVSISASIEGARGMETWPPLPLRRAAWLGLGAGAAEIALRTVELLRQVSLYSDVLEKHGGSLSIENGDSEELDDEQSFEVIEAHLRARERFAIQQQYGVGLDRIPGFLLVLWSVNSCLLSIAFSNLLYLGYLSPTPAMSLDPPLFVTFLIVAALHGTLSASWVILLPLSGLPLVSFASFVVLLLLNFVALALWGVLR